MKQKLTFLAIVVAPVIDFFYPSIYPGNLVIIIIYILQLAVSGIGPRLDVLAEMYRLFPHSLHPETWDIKASFRFYNTPLIFPFQFTPSVRPTIRGISLCNWERCQ